MESNESYIKRHKALFEKVMGLDELAKYKEEVWDYLIFRRELLKESDRGCALLAASRLDFTLEKLLQAKLLGSKKQQKQLFDFSGPLGSFSSRMLMAYSIGIISKNYLHDLQLIRKIRNDFGHSALVISFDDPHIAGICKQLKYARRTNKTPKAMFITTATFILGTLESMTKIEKPFEEKAEIDIEKIKDANEEFEKTVKKGLGIE
jgi:DNA-binding MltR family transcriptional regulator